MADVSALAACSFFIIFLRYYPGTHRLTVYHSLSVMRSNFKLIIWRTHEGQLKLCRGNIGCTLCRPLSEYFYFIMIWGPIFSFYSHVSKGGECCAPPPSTRGSAPTHEKLMIAESIRDTSGDVWESLGIFLSDPEFCRMIPNDFHMIFQVSPGGECFAPPLSLRGSAPVMCSGCVRQILMPSWNNTAQVSGLPPVMVPCPLPSPQGFQHCLAVLRECCINCMGNPKIGNWNHFSWH